MLVDASDPFVRESEGLDTIEHAYLVYSTLGLTESKSI